MMSYPKVSIIILNWNGLDDTVECIESLMKITYPSYEVILVDNGSVGDDAYALIRQFGDYICLIQNDKNLGFAEGNNIAIRQAIASHTPDYILLLNNDTVVHPQFLDELVRVVEQDHKIGLAGAKTYFYDSTNRLQFTTAKINLWIGRVLHIGAGEVDVGQYDTVKDTDYLQGSCLLIKREVIEIIGLLDADYFSYFEETDFCLSAREHGYRIAYCPRAKIWHKGKGWWFGGNAIAAYYMARNRFLLMKKHANRRQIVVFILYYFALQFWITCGNFLVWRRSFRSLIYFLRGVNDGVRLLIPKKPPPVLEGTPL